WLHTYAALLASLGLAGLGQGAVMVLTNKALYDWFPRERRATAMGTKFLAVSLAGCVAGAVVPTLALWIGWGQACAVVGGLMLASALSDGLLYHDPAPVGPRPQPLPAGARRQARGLDRRFWSVVSVGFLFAGVQFAFLTYVALFLHERWALSL